MSLKPKRPELIVITLNQEIDEAEIAALIKNLENSPTVFKYVCGYRGKVVDMKSAVDAVNESKDLNWE